MLKINIKFFVSAVLLSVLFSGCSGVKLKIPKLGVDYPKVNGKIYLHPTTDTTPCNIRPRVKQLLLEHGWEITMNDKEADYEVYTSVQVCRDDFEEEMKRMKNDIAKVSKSSVKANKKFNPNTTNTMVSAANTAQYNSGVGAGMMLVGALLSVGENSKTTHKRVRSKSLVEYKNRISIYNPITKKTTSKSIGSKIYSPAKTEDIDNLIDGLFY